MAFTPPVIIILFYLVTSSVADNTDKPVTETRDIAKEFDDFKKYVSTKLEAMAETHARDMHKLEEIINAQGMQIQKLESDNAMKDSAIQDLQGKIEKLTAKKNNGFQSAGKSQSDESFKETSTKSQVSPKKRGQQHKMVGRASVESKVAFFATVTTQLEHLGKDQDIIFDHAVTNVGNGYLPHHGTFVAPVSGTYVFSVTLLHGEEETTYGHFVVNGSIVAKLYLYSQQTSQLIIVNLRKGDDVSVQNADLDRTFICSQYCTFSGFLLYEVSSVDQIVG
ncbi:complement C1q tumor necrosis factor-related protein 3-like [Ruditapes philippinarum]|uniref:complement C1q tumor necrosis factor-related protein 3-like n=1 Tax=Ruditapes philippinarum TaxID=129788 RepID=UPI00295AE906|nr:complement C1q tumor necrosis factor-related protein 3-like [Ruditapes philippinarum]